MPRLKAAPAGRRMSFSGHVFGCFVQELESLLKSEKNGRGYLAYCDIAHELVRQAYGLASALPTEIDAAQEQFDRAFLANAKRDGLPF
jgi:hypothetical protein